MANEKRDSKPLLNDLLGEGTLTLNANTTVSVKVDNETFLKLFGVILLAGILLFAVWLMLSSLLHHER